MLSIAPRASVAYLTDAVGQGAEHYFMRAIEQAGEPAGVWMGAGSPGLELAGEVDPDVMRDLYEQFIDPRKREEMYAALDALPEAQRHGPEGEKIRADARLGNKPREYKNTVDEKVAAVLKNEPEATPERIKEVEREARAAQKEARTYFDLTFSAPKSWSVYHAALQTAGRHEEAQEVWNAWMEGVQAGLDHMQDQAGYARAGHHGARVEGRSTGRFVDAHEWVVAAFRQHTSRNDDPQLHVHCAVLNKAATIEFDPVLGEERTVWRALDSRQIFKSKQAAGTLAEKVAEEALTRRLGVRTAMRPDGKAREIVGVSPELRDQFSSRRKAITAGVAKLAAAYEETHGRPPGAYTLSRISEHVTLMQRDPKKHAPETREELLARWERAAISELRTSLADVPGQVAWESAQLTLKGETFDPAQVVEDSVAAVQRAKATWTRADLIAELNRHLPDCLGGLQPELVHQLVGDLADQALAPGNEAGALSLVPPDPIDVPDELKRADGLSVYVPNGVVRYATEDHLRAEERILAAAAKTGAPTVPAEIVDAVVAASTLNEAQEAFVRGVATSGDFLDGLIGPAGAGKSYAIGTLTEVWERSGRGVLGLAVGQRAADVLAEEGVTHVANMSMFLRANELMAAGETVRDADLYRVSPGQLVIVDEAGMVDTDQWDAVRQLVDGAGGKLLAAGDHGQLASVGAGGMLRTLAEETGKVYVLDEVLRFTAEWEREASLALREGNHAVLGAYETHGRFRNGTANEMINRAYQGWLADHLEGKQSLIIAGTNEQASELASRARGDLVRAGRVEVDGVELRDGNLAGRGDEVQLRRNDRSLTSTSAQWAVNRTVGTVEDRDENGGLTLALEDGSRMYLAPEYVREHVELAYAGTVHAAQGRTVGTCHSLVDGSQSREGLYVSLTRGKHGNYGYVITHEEATPVEQRPDVLAVLTGVLDRSTAEQSAVAVIRAEAERVPRLDVRAPEWSDLLDQHAEKRYGAILLQALGEEQYRAAAAEEAYGQVIRLARQTEERGHDAESMLVDAVLSRDFGDADSISAIIHWRLNNAVEGVEKSQAQEDRADQEAAEAAHIAAVEQAVGTGQTGLVDVDLPVLTRAAPQAPEGLLDQVLAVQYTDGHQAPDAADPAGHDPEHGQADDLPVLTGGFDVPEGLLNQVLGMQNVDTLQAGRADEVRWQQQDARDAVADARSSYTARTPEDLTGPVGTRARALAEAMDQRVYDLGVTTADEAPEWAVDRLGAVPEHPVAREDWIERAGKVAAYREAHGYEHETDAIGHAPPLGTIDARTAWETARRAVGSDARHVDVARADDAQLREMVEAYRREEAWAPPHVGDELQKMLAAREDRRAQASQLRTQAENPDPAAADPDDATRRLLERAAANDELATHAGDRAEALEQIHTVRNAWHDHTADQRAEASAAQVELTRRRTAAIPPGTAAPQTPEETPAGPDEQQPDRADLRHALDQADRAQAILAERAAQTAEQQTREQSAVTPDEADRERRDLGYEQMEAGLTPETADHERHEDLAELDQ